MRMFRLVIEGAAFCGLLVFWMGMAWHYWGMLEIYAANNYHITHTELYIAVESWLLLSLIVITLLLLKLLGMGRDYVYVEDTGKRGEGKIAKCG